MILNEIKYNMFEKYYIKPTWNIIEYGFTKGWLTPKDIEDFAEYFFKDPAFKDNDEVIQLATCDMDALDKYSIESIIKKLSYKDNIDSGKVWMFIGLKKVLDNMDEDIELTLRQIDDIYCAFGHPDELKKMIYYLPPEDGYDPIKHPKEENYNRLIDFLRKTVQELGTVIKQERIM